MNYDFKSQHGQDEYIIKLLNNKQNGIFVDVGAAHPTKLSNTYIMESELGWTGLLIEADEYFLSQLRQYRTSTVIEALVFNTNTILEYEYIYEPTEGFGNHIRNLGLNHGSAYKLIKTARKSTTTLQQILDSNDMPEIIDYMSLDIEGVELQALKSINLEQYRFRTMTIENNQGTSDIINYLTPYGYKLQHTFCSGYELVIVHKDLI